MPDLPGMVALKPCAFPYMGSTDGVFKFLEVLFRLQMYGNDGRLIATALAG